MHLAVTLDCGPSQTPIVRLAPAAGLDRPWTQPDGERHGN